ncbi:MAG: TonB-dependent receptor [Flavobacteriales bacterium]|nr:TonB-dependent receptor [Flavobacteriales bacterium]MDG1780855.1 TonB-dependent receptor [Flavobacteriales bacterium]MDG2246720.1 TonB-dependent receptor [Flavobacteriales bacterium]
MRLIVFFALLFLPSFMHGFSVSGTVTDASTGEPMIGVNIVDDSGKGASTNIDGLYTLELPTGEHQLSASFIGYEKMTFTVVISNTNVERNIQLKPAAKQIDFVVVSAGKFEQELGEVTVSMEVIKPDIIENKNTIRMDDLLQQTPGVSIVDNEPQIRSGSGFSFGAGSRVMVLLDGLPVLSGDAGRPSWGFLPVENVEQVEVIKGASSVLYGSAALSGVINLRTAYPKAEPKTKISLFHGVYSNPQSSNATYWEGNMMQSGFQFLHSRRIGQLDLVIGGNFLGDDGHQGPIVNYNADGTRRDTASSAYNIFDVNRYAAETRGRINMNLRYRSKKINGLNVGLNTNWLKGESLATLLWENNEDGLFEAFQGSATRTKQVIGTVDPFIEYFTPEGSSHTLQTRWMKLDNDNDNDQGNFSDVFFAQYQYQQNYEHLGVKDFRTTFGVMGQNTTSSSQLYSGENTNGDNTANNYASYFQADKVFFDRLTVSAGVRYEYFEINKSSEGRPVFRAGVNYQAADFTFLRASYGQGFRFPSIAEKFIQTSVGSLTIYPSTELVPETSYNAEIGIKQGFKIGEFKGFIDAAAFVQEYNNFIEFTFGQWGDPATSQLLGFGFRSLNTGDSQVTGAELSIVGTGEIRNWNVNVLAGYTYTKPISKTPDYVYADGNLNPDFESPLTFLSTSSDSTNNILKYRMQHLVRADVEASNDNWLIGFSARYHSSIKNIDQAFILVEDIDPTIQWGLEDWMANNNPNILILDARVGYFFGENQKIALVISNLTNEEYAIRPLAIEPTRLTTLQYTLTF